jgi:hypothetical protein
MKKYIKAVIPLIILVVFNFFVHADLGIPTVQVIARIELIDGHELEGIISLKTG